VLQVLLPIDNMNIAALFSSVLLHFSNTVSAGFIASKPSHTRFQGTEYISHNS